MVPRVRTFRVGGFEAEVTVPQLASGAATQAVVEWSPRVPDFAVDFTPAQRSEYRRALIAAIVEMRR